MTEKPELTPNVIPFPARLRLVPAQSERYAHDGNEALAAVEHDGRAYDLAGLIRHLSPKELREIGDTAPRSGQELWDQVVRHWPALAAEIVAGVGPLS